MSNEERLQHFFEHIDQIASDSSNWCALKLKKKEKIQRLAFE